MGGGYLKEGSVLDIDTLKNAVKTMEQVIWI